MNRKTLRTAAAVLLLFIVTLACSVTAGGGGQPAKIGTVKITNRHVRGSDAYPGGLGLPDAREYGICIIAYPPGFPAGMDKPTYDIILAKDAQTTTYTLPTGPYSVQEFQFDSEINQDPTYSPEFRTLYRPVEMMVLDEKTPVVFGSDRTSTPPGDFGEGVLASSVCNGSLEHTAGQGEDFPGGTTGDQPTHPVEGTDDQPVDLPTDTPEVAGGGWVLKLVQPDVGKSEEVFNYPGLECTGGAKATSSETEATITASGTCQIKGALTANQVTQHTWSRPPDRLTPGQVYTATLTAKSSGLCSWTGATTEENCRSGVGTRHLAWQGDGWPGGPVEFPYQDLIYGNDFANTARANDNPTAHGSWTVPDGGTGGGKTLLLQFCASSSGAKVYTNFWYAWSGK